MRLDALTFPISESTGYVHWLGKGETGQQEWTFWMYNETTTDVPPRPNRISFYVFNLDGHKGVASYFQEPVAVGEDPHSARRKHHKWRSSDPTAGVDNDRSLQR